MVYGAISMKDEEFYTDLHAILGKMGRFHRRYNWLISDHVCMSRNSDIEKMLYQDKLPGFLLASCGENTWHNWMNGEELEKVSREVYQWIWGVFSAFEPDVTEEQAVSYPLPYSDMNRDLWTLPLKMQNPLAKVEIVAFDSSYCMIYTTEKEIYDKFREAFPLSEDLVAHLNELLGKNKV